MSETMSRIHPLVATAAGSVIVLCAVGVGVMTGIIPSSFSKNSAEAPVAVTAAPAPEATKVEAPKAVASTTEKHAAEPAAKHVPAKTATSPTPARKTAETSHAPAPVKTAEPAPVPAQGQEPVRVASAEPAITPPPSPPAPRVCSECGTVVDVATIEQKGEGSGMGAVAGGVLGGILGNQIGAGNGRKLATIAGVAGGAIAGHQVERQVKSTKRYDVAVRMEDGTVRHFNYDVAPTLRSGDPVRVVDGTLSPR